MTIQRLRVFLIWQNDIRIRSNANLEVPVKGTDVSRFLSFPFRGSSLFLVELHNVLNLVLRRDI
jgi:hypothetical protein